MRTHGVPETFAQPHRSVCVSLSVVVREGEGLHLTWLSAAEAHRGALTGMSALASRDSILSKTETCSSAALWGQLTDKF